MKISIIGANGSIAPSVINALLSPLFSSKVSFPVRVITSKDTQSTDKLTYIKHPIDDSLVDVLKGTEVLMSFLPTTEELNAKVESVVEKLRPNLFIPSEYGGEIDKVDPKYLPSFFKSKIDHSKRLIEKNIRVARIQTSSIRIPPAIMYGFTDHIGIYQESGTVRIADDYETRVVDFSTLSDVGNVVAAVATTDPSKTLPLYRVRSDRIGFKDLVSKFEAQQNRTYEIQHFDLDEEFQKFRENPNDFIHGLFVTSNLGEGRGAAFEAIENEVINPKQSLWKWSSWE
ncbi:hypothetical protein CLIB1444_03S07492 [[Candida] jaroonii]|uniref:Uncharacterized protein n=1 Tax=[Candida] jaroonii TaxID=467808 RepID=A0ACA9Y5J2_9ASCO|nr:hypothetical protein CLIB1444_03S07492 [[Candida] jaroonii]